MLRSQMEALEAQVHEQTLLEQSLKAQVEARAKAKPDGSSVAKDQLSLLAQHVRQVEETVNSQQRQIKELESARALGSGAASSSNPRDKAPELMQAGTMP